MSNTNEEIDKILEGVASEYSGGEVYGGSKPLIVGEASQAIQKLIKEREHEAVRPYWPLEFAVEEAIKNGVYMPLVEDAYYEFEQLKHQGE